MKKLITLIILITLFSGVLKAQTTVVRNILATKDTQRITTIVTTSVKYDTLKYKPVYLASLPVAYKDKSNFTISGLTFSNGTVLISLINCTNVHITNCRFLNASQYAIATDNCSNITIDNNFFTGIAFGVYAHYGTGIKVNINQCLNLKGNVASNIFAHFVQLDNVNGGGSQINYNRVENIAGVAVNPHDIISLYQSNGLPGDSIQVIGNWIRGGQITLNALKNNGACGIGLGDSGGSYQVCRGNILVNPGYVGIQPQGGNSICDRIKVDHNTIYSKQTPVSLLALSSGHIGSNVFIGYNWLQWLDYNGHQDDQWYNGTQPQGISTNYLNAAISASVLPPVIITMK